MSQIFQLDEHLANQIAAGEVVERPLSVVKELVENALDAGATNIIVKIQEGGTTYIEVKDNGSGIESRDLELAVQKYTTSKISSLEDLYNVMTFGFRGEALASIASVSEFFLGSYSKKEQKAFEVEFSGGKKKHTSEIPLSEGTRVIVKNLFFNTPARLNYLKKPKTEYNHIADFLQKTALSYPEIGFQVISDDKEVYNFHPNETQKERIYSVYGSEVSDNMERVSFQYGGISLEGYITNPKVFFTNKTRQALFVNKRNISSHIIYKALMDAYNRFIPPRTFPSFVLNVQIDPTQVDVNVHPRKQEIRFANEQSIYRLFYHGIKNTLESVSLVSHAGGSHEDIVKDTIPYSFSSQEKTDSQPSYYTGSGTKFKSYSPYKNTDINPNQSQIQDALSFSQAMIQTHSVEGFEKSTDLHDTPLGKIIGQLHNSYIVIETSLGVKILDQHAVAERVIYEKISRSAYTPKVQGLLMAETLQVTPKEMEVITRAQEVFERMGFEVEVLTGNGVMISGVPDFIKKDNIKDIFLGILSDIDSDVGAKSKTLDEVRNKIWAYTACRSAIKFGDKLSLFEMNQLLYDAALDYSATCPHGRPVVWEMNLDDLQKKYER